MASHSISEKIRIIASRIFVIILLLVVLFSKSHWQIKHEMIGASIFATGCFLTAIGSMGRLWCSLYIAGYKNNTLVTTGPYSISRNPLYFFSLIGATGVGLTTETLLVPFIFIIVFIVFYPWVIRGEEKRLLSIHGEKFDLYRQRVPVFLPKFSLFEEPQTYAVNPKIFKKNIVNSLWFIWFIGILEIVEALHETGILPTYFPIY